MNILSNEMNIEGVAAFNFSDSQTVYVVPKEQQVKLTKNMAWFNEWIQA